MKTQQPDTRLARTTQRQPAAAAGDKASQPSGQIALQGDLAQSPRALAQRRALDNSFGSVTQRTEDDALAEARSISRYAYASFSDVMKDKASFSPEDWSRIVRAYNKGNTGGLRLRDTTATAEDSERDDSKIVDKSGNTVPDQKLGKEELSQLISIKQTLQKAPEHESLLYDLEMRVRRNLGMVGFQQFYRGGHIVFNDSGEVYQSIVKAHGALMKARYTAKKQTSHYNAKDGFDTSIEASTPQMGVDLPSPLNGHILIGIVPSKTGKSDSGGGNTFVQTEMYGFQDVYNSVVGHGIGFVVSATGYGNSGLVGYSPNSEKQNREIREADNPT